MRINIYFATKRVTICDEPTDTFEIAITKINRKDLLDLLDRYQSITIRTTDIDATYTSFNREFKPVIAAGGVVKRDDKMVLMIHRNGHWDLPKGHWEQGETIEECAVREVEEETGVSGITIGDKICETLHAYCIKGEWEVKTTHWYSMQSNDTKELKPQTEEGIESAVWCTVEQMRERAKGSFPTIQSVIERVTF